MSTENVSPLLSVKDLRVAFRGRGRRGAGVDVLKGVSLDIRPGETLGLVGESGSGKTTVGRAILGLAPVTGGSITFDGVDLTKLAPGERRRAAAQIQVVFQDPYSSLNPSMTIESILSEPLLGQGRQVGRERVRELLDRVGLPADSGGRLAREFSGGQRQRIAIARALALRPKLIICDEPTSALDLSTQIKVLDLFLEIQEATECAYLFVTHDLAVVRRMSHRIAVLLNGEIVEEGDAQQVSDRPDHPYTRQLQMAAPVADPVLQRQRRLARREFLEKQDLPVA
ncbi:ABC transporter ATP-binding protein [Streptomyces sp. NPDC057253]|uniref:ABC transporter ATP-binding protein n=1 Tax=Streptomyces sp. NPDC057253 TaxID=3346069 RepID=UPI003633584A